MEDYSKVSLGFAEFVSQLLHETFDAVLSAQHYQMDKYSELEKALSMSPGKFAELYINETTIEQREQELFGVTLSANLKLTSSIIDTLKNIVVDFDQSKMVINNLLTSAGLLAAKAAIREILVTEHKAKLRQLINNSEMTRLIVESGEIKAKLELSNLYENTQKSEQPELTDKKKSMLTAANIQTQRVAITKPLAVSEIADPVSKQKTIVVNKAALSEISNVSAAIPKVRIIATPLTGTSSSNLYSEVTIRFKTV